MQFYEIFERLRKEKNVSLSKCLSDMGLSRGAFYKWKNKGSEPLIETKILIAEYFNTTTDYLDTGDESKKEPPKTDGSDINVKSALADLIINELLQLSDEKQRKVLRYIYSLADE